MVEGESNRKNINSKCELARESAEILRMLILIFIDSNVRDDNQLNGSSGAVPNKDLELRQLAGSGDQQKFDSKQLATFTDPSLGARTKDPERNVGHHHGIKADFEQAIELAGYGKFHYILLAICGLVSTSEEMDVISMSFILPSAQCDLHLNTQTKGWLNSIIFIGMMVGAYFWGSLADSMGRKRVLIVISIMNALCIVASSFTQNYALFMIFRFLNGVA